MIAWPLPEQEAQKATALGRLLVASIVVNELREKAFFPPKRTWDIWDWGFSQTTGKYVLTFLSTINWFADDCSDFDIQMSLLFLAEMIESEARGEYAWPGEGLTQCDMHEDESY